MLFDKVYDKYWALTNSNGQPRNTIDMYSSDDARTWTVAVGFDEEAAVVIEVPAVSGRAIVIHAAAVETLEAPAETTARNAEIDGVLDQFARVWKHMAQRIVLRADGRAAGAKGVFRGDAAAAGAGQTNRHGVGWRKIEKLE